MTAHARMNGDVLLVGSLPYETVEDALSAAGALGDTVSGLPDGEVGDRMTWTNVLPMHVYSKHPDIVETRSPTEYMPTGEEEGFRGAAPEFQWTFQLRPGVNSIDFDDLGYASNAIDSYRTFVALRDGGVIAPSVRFQVSLPATGSAVNQFFDDPNQWPAVHAAYTRAIGAEIEKILASIPADDLQIQFDLAWEVNDLSIGDERYFDYWPQLTYAEKFAMHTAPIAELTNGIPDEVLVGFHWCYGTWGGWPMTDMDDLGLCVELSNAAVAQASRRIDYVHMPVTLDPGPTFFDALKDLKIGDTKVYLGLLHHEDGLEGSRRRIEMARRVLPDFGIAAVCGYGREDPAELGDVFALSRASAAALRE